jgi:hypothetical protein
VSLIGPAVGKLARQRHPLDNRQHLSGRVAMCLVGWILPLTRALELAGGCSLPPADPSTALPPGKDFRSLEISGYRRHEE